MAQVVAYFSGAESGDTSELSTTGAGSSAQTSTVKTGAYAFKVAGTACVLKSGLSVTQSVIRAYIQPTSAAADVFIEGTPTNRAILTVTAALKLQLHDGGSTLGLASTTGTTVLTAGVWYLIEMALDLAAGGVVKAWINGNLELNLTHTNDVSATPTERYKITGAANPNEYFFDDIRFDTGGVTEIGRGQCIARQGTTGSPTNDAWTKNGAATAALCWSNTPFSTSTNCSTATASAAQTMFIAGFNATQSGHGSEVLGSTDTINATKIGLVGKTSNATTDGADSIRRRVGGVNTDQAITAFTTSDAYREILATLTYANLTNGTTEIGVVKTATGSRTHTVEDMWIMIDYTPFPFVVSRRTLNDLGTRAGSRQMGTG